MLSSTLLQRNSTCVRQAAVSARSSHTLHEPCRWVSWARSRQPTLWPSKRIAYVLGRWLPTMSAQTICVAAVGGIAQLLRVMLLGSIAPRPVLTCAIARACPLVPLTSQMDDRSSESDSSVAEQNPKTPPNVGNLLTSQGQATPSVRGRLHLNKLKLRLFRAVSKILFTTSRRLADLAKLLHLTFWGCVG